MEPNLDVGATTYVGTLPGTDAYVAVLTEERHALAFVCDGEQIGLWLEGMIGRDGLVLVSSRGASARATIENEQVGGTITLINGSSHRFIATLAEREAGLYRNETTIDGITYVAGQIVFADGTKRGRLTILDKEGEAIDIGAPPPPSVVRMVEGAATPRRVTKATKVPAPSAKTLCALATLNYEHVYDLWVEHGRPESGGLSEALKEAYNDMWLKCV